MQRTVKSTVFTYVVNDINEKGEVNSKIATVEVPEVDHKKALKSAFKKVGYFAPLKSEVKEDLWILDDETFFKYAKKADRD